MVERDYFPETDEAEAVPVVDIDSIRQGRTGFEIVREIAERICWCVDCDNARLSRQLVWS
jgi:hypothetical protein